MKLSTRNILTGKVVDVKEGPIMSKVKVDIGNGNFLTSLISSEAAHDLDLRIGEEIKVLIKATSVMLGKE